MDKAKRVTAVVGTYRKGGIIDQAVDAILASARQHGAEVQKVFLLDKHIEFCTNCRVCMQEPGAKRGRCPIADDTDSILDLLESSDSIVLASPMNCGTVTAVMKRFIERTACYAYWPWGTYVPKWRSKARPRTAVLVGSSAAPAIMARLMTKMVGLLKSAAGGLGAKPIGTLFVGIACTKPDQELSASARRRAAEFGRKLAT